MKFRYDKEDDALMIWFSREPVDYAEQERDIIVHFSKKNKPVLMEVLNASNFLMEASQVFPQKIREHVVLNTPRTLSSHVQKSKPS